MPGRCRPSRGLGDELSSLIRPAEAQAAPAPAQPLLPPAPSTQAGPVLLCFLLFLMSQPLHLLQPSTQRVLSTILPPPCSSSSPSLWDPSSCSPPSWILLYHRLLGLPFTNTLESLCPCAAPSEITPITPTAGSPPSSLFYAGSLSRRKLQELYLLESIKNSRFPLTDPSTATKLFTCPFSALFLIPSSLFLLHKLSPLFTVSLASCPQLAPCSDLSPFPALLFLSFQLVKGAPCHPLLTSIHFSALPNWPCHSTLWSCCRGPAGSPGSKDDVCLPCSAHHT